MVLTVALFIKVPLTRIRVTKIRDTGSSTSRSPISQIPVILLKLVPVGQITSISSRPVGKVSLTRTFSAKASPRFITVMFHVTFSPT